MSMCPLHPWALLTKSRQPTVVLLVSRDKQMCNLCGSIYLMWKMRELPTMIFYSLPAFPSPIYRPINAYTVNKNSADCLQF